MIVAKRSVRSGSLAALAAATLAFAGAASAEAVKTVNGVDIDSTVESDAKRFVIEVDRQRAALLGVSQQSVANILGMALDGQDVTYVHQARERYPIPVRLEVPVASKSDLQSLLALEVRSRTGQRVPIAEIASVQVRTLQRRLRAEGLSFKKLVDQARFLETMDLVGDQDVTFTEIAHHLGYTDQAHFTRAFRRWAGVTPSWYRSELLRA